MEGKREEKKQSIKNEKQDINIYWRLTGHQWSDINIHYLTYFLQQGFMDANDFLFMNKDTETIVSLKLTVTLYNQAQIFILFCKFPRKSNE